MTGSENLEVEVKFYIQNLAALRLRAMAAGAQQQKSRLFERNVRYDTPGETLRFQWQLLRLRQDDRVRLTFKGPAGENTNQEAKVREELEIEVSDFATAELILQRLGFEGVQVYEKYRETLWLDDVELVLDELPFGNFVELEGEETAIRRAAATLDLDWSRRILDNYLMLLARLNSHYNLSLNDLTFANFAELDLSMSDVLLAGDHDDQL